MVHVTDRIGARPERCTPAIGPQCQRSGQHIARSFRRHKEVAQSATE